MTSGRGGCPLAQRLLPLFASCLASRRLAPRFNFALVLFALGTFGAALFFLLDEGGARSLASAPATPTLASYAARARSRSQWLDGEDKRLSGES